MADESTTKIKVDLSELKKEFKDAQRHIQLVNSEFKAATAGMGKWSDSADGVSAKIKQLNGVLDAENAKLKSLENQYAMVAKEQGENSKGAQELMIKINNQKAAVEKVKSSLGYYTDKLEEMTSESKQAASASDTLKDTISKQESELNSLKATYANLVLEQGKSSQEAKDTAKQISKLSEELQQNKSAMKEAEKAADQFDKSLDDVEDSANDASDGFTVMKGALADLLADGIKSAAGALKDFVVESDSAYSKFQAQTGASTEEMKEFQGQMDELYENAYGESLQDIGDKMAYVKQVTGEVDPSKIKELTENAIALEDTFGSDFNETIRGVNNLMQHFGIDSEEAFDLFAKGSQLGLDYTDELGDNIAEYGGNFEQAGYSAEEYFQLLVNGSKNGAYNLDKVNDSINEVKNRLGDGTIEKNIKTFSKGTQKVFKNWQDGKGTMKDVIDSIVDDINNCTDEQEALTMAQVAFGTMGEDANLKVVRSLKSTGDSFKNVKGTMEEMKDIRYDDVGTQFKQLGRTLMTELVKPLAEKALPQFEKLADGAIKNIDKIIPVAKALGVVLTGMFVTNKISTFVTSLKTLIPAFTATKAATDAQTASTLAANAAWLASPITWIVAGLAAVTAAVVIYNKKQKEAIEAEYGLTEAQEKTIEKSSELKKSYDEMNESRNQSMAAVDAEYSHLTELKDELLTLVDANGKVIKGNEDRANFIVNQLASALGIEKEKVWEIIQSNGELSKSIDALIEKKKAEAMLSANEAAYTEAIQKRNEALSTYQSSLQTLKEAEDKYNQTKDKANKTLDTFNELLKTSPEAAAAYYSANKQLIDGNEEAKKSYDKAKKGADDAEQSYVGYLTTIQNYEGLSSAIISGDAAKIQAAMNNIENSFITAENGTRDSLERQVKNMEQNLSDIQTAIENGTPGVTEADRQMAQQMVDAAKAELDKLPPEAGESGTEAGEAHADGVSGTSKDNEQAGSDVANATKKGLESSDTKGAGDSKAKQFGQGVTQNEQYANYAGSAVSQMLNKGLGSSDTKSTGSGSVNNFNSGVNSVDTFATAKARADLAKSGLAAVNAYNTGDNFTAGFKNGMSGGQASTSIWSAAWNLGKNALNALKAAIKEGSPSKLTHQSGDYFVAGFANAIAEGVKTVVPVVQKMGEAAINTLNDEMSTGIDVPTVNGISSVKAAGSKIGRTAGTVMGGQVINNYTYNQYNNSPKALSRLEIYRQTKNQLNFAKGV